MEGAERRMGRITEAAANSWREHALWDFVRGVEKDALTGGNIRIVFAFVVRRDLCKTL
jgi:hypothetical protein